MQSEERVPAKNCGPEVEVDRFHDVAAVVLKKKR